MKARVSSWLAATLLLAGCDGAPDRVEKPEAEADAAIGEALGGPIMVDPALAGQDHARAGMAGGGAASAGIPPEARSAEAVAGALAEAARLAGSSIRSAPAPGVGPPSAMTVTAGQFAATVPAARTCADKLDYSAMWAAKLPAVLSVYSRGHVQEAAGTDRDGCRLRVVNFVTPVAVSHVIDFYFTRTAAAGYTAERLSQGRDDVLSGRKGGSTFVLHVRRRDDGLTEADLVSIGG